MHLWLRLTAAAAEESEDTREEAFVAKLGSSKVLELLSELFFLFLGQVFALRAETVAHHVEEALDSLNDIVLLVDLEFGDHDLMRSARLSHIELSKLILLVVFSVEDFFAGAFLALIR